MAAAVTLGLEARGNIGRNMGLATVQVYILPISSVLMGLGVRFTPGTSRLPLGFRSAPWNRAPLRIVETRGHHGIHREFGMGSTDPMKRALCWRGEQVDTRRVGKEALILG